VSRPNSFQSSSGKVFSHGRISSLEVRPELDLKGILGSSVLVSVASSIRASIPTFAHAATNIPANRDLFLSVVSLT
jgi:hypothetical protein